MIAFAVAAAAPADLPLWMILIGVVLGGGTLAAIFQYFGSRTTAKAAAPGVEALANLTGVQALMATIGALSAENLRLTDQRGFQETSFKNLATKLDQSQAIIVELKTDLTRYPTKDDLIEQIGKLQTQLIGKGETPTNGPIKP